MPHKPVFPFNEKPSQATPGQDNEHREFDNNGLMTAALAFKENSLWAD